MKMREGAWSVGYSLFEVIQGQLIHPYQTMRQIVREKVFVWMTLSPIFLWAVSLIVWRVISFALFFLIPYPMFWIFLAVWFTVGIGMYQVLLGYLFVRFRAAIR